MTTSCWRIPQQQGLFVRSWSSLDAVWKRVCIGLLVLTHAAIWQVQPPKVKRPVRASLIFNGYTLGFIAAVAFARWLREQNSTEGVAATLLVLVVPFVFWLQATRALPNRASRAPQLLPSGSRRCTCSRRTSSARS